MVHPNLRFISFILTNVLISSQQTRLRTSKYIANFLDLNLLNFLGPRSFEKGSYHTNRFINLLYSDNFISYLLLHFIVISVVNL